MNATERSLVEAGEAWDTQCVARSTYSGDGTSKPNWPYQSSHPSTDVTNALALAFANVAKLHGVNVGELRERIARKRATGKSWAEAVS